MSVKQNTKKQLFDFDISVVHYQKKHVKNANLLNNNPKYNYYIPVQSKLVLDISGLNLVEVNTIRRTCIDMIPTFAYKKQLMNITKNTSVVNNDIMRYRLEQLPIYDVSNDLILLEPKYYDNIDYDDPNIPRFPGEKQIEASIDVVNDTNDNLNVTTNDIKFYENMTERQIYDKKCPILLVQLKPKEIFKATLKGILGVGLANNIWSAASNAYYNDEKKDSIQLTIESLGQITEFEILIKACKNIIEKLEKTKLYINDIVDKKEITLQQHMVFTFEGEDHTLCNLINDAFQDHPEIAYSGVSKKDHLINKMNIDIVSANNIDNPIKPMLQKFDYLIDKFNTILKKCEKLK